MKISLDVADTSIVRNKMSKGETYIIYGIVIENPSVKVLKEFQEKLGFKYPDFSQENWENNFPKVQETGDKWYKILYFHSSKSSIFAVTPEYSCFSYGETWCHPHILSDTGKSITEQFDEWCKSYNIPDEYVANRYMFAKCKNLRSKFKNQIFLLFHKTIH